MPFRHSKFCANFDLLKKKVKVYKEAGRKVVKIQHTGENRDKVDFILTTAQNRFGLYGLEKTTMREIAEDAGMSKASLYYYFPDKTSLFHAVIKKEQDDFFRYLDESRFKLNDPDEMLHAYITIRNLYFQKFINLSKLRFNAIRELRPMMRDLLDELRSKEMDYIRNIIDLGAAKSVYRNLNTDDVATIFLESLQAIRRSYLGRTNLMGIDSADMEGMGRMMEVFLAIFIHGIAGDGGAGQHKK